ncbi:MAG: c-type cytochrome biogenesis protein CcmI [Rubellimicrobium sp.]|nr:c-type cytochrome biogenesis protein CcmI [Rubellimicrobium sp.]
MLFWIIVVGLSVAVCASLAMVLLRPADDAAAKGEATGEGARAASEDVAIYRDQLAEVERDLARGVLDQTEAERTRTEIARRLLAADRAGAARLEQAPHRANLVAGGLAGVVLVGGSLWVYTLVGAPGMADQPRAARLAESASARETRMSQAEAEALFAAIPRPVPQVDPEFMAAIERLRELMPQNEENVTGWEMLAMHEAQLGNFAAAAAAQARVVALRGPALEAGDLEDLLDRMVGAAGGHVSPEADAVIERLEAIEPGNLAARYYAGLMHVQTGRYDLAFALWRTVVETAPDRNLYKQLAMAQIEDIAWLSGRNYTPPAAMPGPTDEEMAAAADLDPEVREAMVRGMVTQLAERLASQGGPAEDWARLITAYVVLGEVDMAGSIWAEAREAFATNPPSMEILTEAARAVGLTE